MHSLQELVAEQGRLAPFRRDVRICWEFLEREIRAAKAREDKARRRQARGPAQVGARAVAVAAAAVAVAAAAAPAVAGPAPAAAHWVTGVGRVVEDEGVEDRTKPSPLRVAADVPVGVSKFQRALAEKAAKHRRPSLEFRPRWGAGDPSPSTKRLKEKKEKLAKYSVASSLDAKIRAERRASQELAAEDARRLGEARAMREEDRSALERRFFEVGREPVFFMKAHAFLPVTVFLNHRRDYLVAVCRADAADVFEPLLFKERDLAAAANDAKFRGAEPLASAPPAPRLRRGPAGAAEAPDFAAHYLFKRGRLTMPATDRVALIGVDCFSREDAVRAGNYVDAASFGDFTAAATRDWRPAADDGGALRTSFIGALKEAKSTVKLNAADHATIARSSQRVRRNSDSLARMHEQDARLLDDLISGYAPGQLRPRPRSAAAPRSTPKALSRLRSGSAKRPAPLADVDANVARARSYEPKRTRRPRPRRAAREEALERRLAALERSREAGEDGAENPEHYAHTYDDDEFLLRPTLFGATGWDLSNFSYEQRRSADERRRDAPAPAPAGGDRVVDHVVDYAVGGDALGAAFAGTPARPAAAWRRAPGVARRAATGTCCYVSHPTPHAFVASGPVAWKRRNPHVVFEPDGIARRHPSSRWHNFRAVVLDEEVASGAVAYDVAVLKLTGGAVAVGVVGEDARVNELNDWVLGLELETAALVAKGPALDREAPFDGLGLFSTARCAACGGDARARPT
ncbi:hypothetical protein JL722_1080 [Aureococcus anophagefferens]|nr:hypothetical protein JL722_1080 [Aureococcus anophagefferens]